MRTRDVVLLGLASAAIAAALVAGPTWRRTPSEPPPPESAPPAPPPEPPAPAPPRPTGPVPLPAWAAVAEGSDAACSEGMVLVDALHCPYLAHRCADGGARDEPCHRFVPEVLCEGDRRRKRFCIDRFEYPNQEGARPVAGVSFEEAERACAADDKRLCTTSEWELACEGPGLWPLPTGVRRDPRACAIDRARFARTGLAPAGLLQGCASPFGVVDAMGGVDEWVLDETGGTKVIPLRWSLAGGSSAGGRPCRTRLSPTSPAARPDAGFRCCADATVPRPGEEPRRATAPAPAAERGEKAPLAGWTALDVPGDPPPDPAHDGLLPTRPGLD